MKSLFLFLALTVGGSVFGVEKAPRVFILDAKVIQENRQRVLAGDPALQPALEKLIRDADAKLAVGPFSVTQKIAPPSSGDLHDYQSLSPYWWPDPKKPDGLPYIRKDGQVNPERAKVGDRIRFGDMQSAVISLSTAWYFSGEEKYATHAAKLLRIWFIDLETRMNPNMNLAQAVPGRAEGRCFGIVDAAGMPGLIDAVGMLETSKVWKNEDQQALVEWFSEFVDWLQNSKNGREEDNTANNHATQYDAQVACYALFVGKPEIARKVLNAVGSRRIDTQIQPDGSQPHELKRTKSWDYSCANTRNFSVLAELGRKVDVDLWGYDQNGKSILGTLNFLLPYADGLKTWERKQIKDFDPRRLLIPLLQAAPYDESGRYALVAAKLMAAYRLENLLYARP